jgi:hypothetical protein
MEINGKLHALAALTPGEEYHLDTRLGESQSRNGLCAEKKNILLPPGIEPRPSSPQFVAIWTELSRLLSNVNNLSETLCNFYKNSYP